MNLIIIQARLSSKRLPKKIFLEFGGSRLVDIVFARVAESKFVDEIVFAITESKSDDELYKYLLSKNYLCNRGSEYNVLERFYLTAKKYNAKNIIRVTSDDPLKDWNIIDKAVNILQSENLDYVSNTIEPSYPEGLDIEVFKFSALEKAYNEAKLDSEKEHVTPYIWKNPNKFDIKNFKFNQDLSHFRWTIDKKQDVKFFNKVTEIFGKLETLDVNLLIKYLLDNPELIEINNNTIRNEGYKKSILDES